MRKHDFRNAATWTLDLWMTSVQSLWDRQRAASPSDGWDPLSLEAFVRQILPGGIPGVAARDYAEVDWRELCAGWNSLLSMQREWQ